MNPQVYHDFIVPAAMKFFPAHFNTKEARALVLAIGLQESEFRHRTQLVGGARDWWKSINAPANGFMQFELIGVTEVLRNPATKEFATYVCELFGYPTDPVVIHKALVHNDLLSAAWARLALWRVREPLPSQGAVQEAWRQYEKTWAPGKPKPEKWPANYKLAWEIVNAGY